MRWVEVLRDHPSPALAVALYKCITAPGVATQTPYPGFHKDQLEALMATVAKHPALGEAIAASKRRPSSADTDAAAPASSTRSHG